MNYYRCYKVCVPSTRKIIISDTLKFTDDNLFEVPHKSKDDNLHDTITEIKTMLHSQYPLPTHTNKPRAHAIEKLHNLLLQRCKPDEIASLLPKANENHDDIQLLRVSMSFTDDPPELEDEVNYDEDNYTNIVFTEHKEDNAPLPSTTNTRKKQ